MKNRRNPGRVEEGGKVGGGETRRGEDGGREEERMEGEG